MRACAQTLNLELYAAFQIPGSTLRVARNDE